MLIIPAIDLKDHQVVRLKQGRMEDVTIYASDPVEMARRWIGEGAGRLHLVDLNGAFLGKPFHAEEVKKIAQTFPQIEIQIGGGIRSLETIQAYFEAGARYAILGTIAVKDPELVKKAAALYPNQIILGIDARDGMVATQGWDQVERISAHELVKSFHASPIHAVVYTDIARDGMLQGMNIPSIQAMAEISPFPIIASGGLTSNADFEALDPIKNVMGCIAGKALYEGRVGLKRVS